MTKQRATRRRSVWVWLISIFYLGFGASGLMTVGMALILLYRGGLAPEDLAVIKTLLRASMWGLLPTANIAGAASLFLLRRIAFPIFISLLIIRLALPVVFGTHPVHGFSGADSQIITGYIAGFGILLAVCIYVYRLQKSGVLR